VSAATQNMLLRLPAELMAELETACADEGLDRTEMVIQGLFIRLRMKDKSKVGPLLDAYGYQPRRRPGRPRKDTAALNGKKLGGTLNATGGLHEDA
jgi:hypothetical protein